MDALPTDVPGALDRAATNIHDEIEALDAEPLSPATVADALGASPPLPRPGDRKGDRIVRASGTMPASGRRFVLFRHDGHLQMAAIRNAQAEAKAEERDASPADQMIHLLAQVLVVEQAGTFAPLNVDSVLDMDGDDLDVVTMKLQEAAPFPRTPSSS